MKILGFDSAGKAAGAAVWDDGTILYEANLRAGLTHSQTLLSLCEQALSQTQLRLSDIDFMALNLGPGSFTGLRIGLASAKGLCFADDIPCIGVSTLESLAYALPVEGNVLCALDARRREVYAAGFRRTSGGVLRLSEDKAAPVEALRPVLEQMEGPIYLMGDGAHSVYEQFAKEFPVCDPHLLSGQGTAAGVCMCAASHAAQALDAEILTPDYLRLSQAQRERAERLAAQQQANG